MCGIAGFINFTGHNPEEARSRIKQMTRVLAHRGPDQEGFYVDDHAALGHRRLSIIDLAAGRQPMSTGDQRLTVVFNGEIYNFLELRAELEGLGHRFRTRSDTEVILAAYRQWGSNCCTRLWGMFAFAVWDREDKRLFLARDRVGKKPLYYSLTDHGIAFSSEIKGLLAGNLCERSIDPRALDCYLCFGYIPSPLSIFKGTSKIRPGHYVEYTSEGIKEKKYWDLSFNHQEDRSFDDAIEECTALLSDAVKKRLISEVPLGAFLSGGIDSTLVVSFMADLLDGPVRTNSIGFDVSGDDELPVARVVASHIKADHREFYVTPRAADVLEQIAWHFDEPFADSSALPTWYVCKMTRENVTVALSGDGGDESFGGYTFRYVPHILESKLRKVIPSCLRVPLFGAAAACYPASSRLPRPLRLKTILGNLSTSDSEAFCLDLGWLTPDTRLRLYNKEFLHNLMGFHPFEMVMPFYAGARASDPLSRAQNADIHFYMTEDVLVKVDRMSMAHALEVRSPFLDHRLLEFAATLPSRLKIHGRQGKVLLRALARKRLPAEVSGLPKKGFSIPAARWLRGELKEYARDHIFNKNGLARECLDPATLQDIWQEHQEGHRDHSVLLWSLMMLGLWEKIWMDDKQ